MALKSIPTTHRPEHIHTARPCFNRIIFRSYSLLTNDQHDHFINKWQNVGSRELASYSMGRIIAKVKKPKNNQVHCVNHHIYRCLFFFFHLHFLAPLYDVCGFARHSVSHISGGGTSNRVNKWTWTSLDICFTFLLIVLDFSLCIATTPREKYEINANDEEIHMILFPADEFHVLHKSFGYALLSKATHFLLETIEWKKDRLLHLKPTRFHTTQKLIKILSFKCL